MASKKSLDERINEKNEQLQKALETAKQYEAQVKQLERRRKEEERKKRTRRLIEIGGSVESVLGREFVDGDIIRLMNFLKDQNARGGYFTAAMQGSASVKDESQVKPSSDEKPKPHSVNERLRELQERELEERIQAADLFGDDDE